MTDLFGSSSAAAPPQAPLSGATRGGVIHIEGRMRILHRCFVCNSDLAPFGRGSVFRVEEMVWACREHRGALG